MARYFSVHPVDPQRRAIGQVIELVRSGGLIAYPTDSCFALGCRLGNSGGLHRIREIRDLDDKAVDDTLGVVLKHASDHERAIRELRLRSKTQLAR